MFFPASLPLEDTNPDLVQANPCQSDAFDRWTKIEVGQEADLLHGLSLVVDLLVGRLCLWASCSAEKYRPAAKLEVS